jgi:hypothetical protein
MLALVTALATLSVRGSTVGLRVAETRDVPAIVKLISVDSAQLSVVGRSSPLTRSLMKR